MSILTDDKLQIDGKCFACGPENPHGLGMMIQYEKDHIFCRISLAAHFQGWAGIAHGGVVAAMLDEVMAYAVLHFLGSGVTASMDLRYRKPVPLEKELLVTGWIANQRGKLAETQARLALAADQQVLAEAKAKFLLSQPFQTK